MKLQEAGSKTFFSIQLRSKLRKSRPKPLSFAQYYHRYARNLCQISPEPFFSINQTEVRPVLAEIGHRTFQWLMFFMNSTKALVISPEIMHKTSKWLEAESNDPQTFLIFNQSQNGVQICNNVLMKLDRHGYGLETCLNQHVHQSLRHKKVYNDRF